jgi:hypothetical protein
MLTTGRPDYVDLECVLAPQQFSDTAEQKEKDVRKVFKVYKDCDIICGTESGEEPLTTLVRDYGKKAGFRVYLVRGHWIAVNERIISPRGWHQRFVPVIESFEGRGRHTDRGVAVVRFNHLLTGDQISVAAGHYLTQGGRVGDPNWDWNGRYAKAIGRVAKEEAKGHGVFIYMGDQNTNDELFDTFKGEPVTSVWDELNHYPNTHRDRTIDVIATYDKDKRMRALKAWVENDKKQRFHFDHYVTRATLRLNQRPKLKLS